MPALPDVLPDLPVPAGWPVRPPLPPDRPVRWGILATGRIAHSFARDLRLLPDAEIAAVGSRRLESAGRFAEELGVTRAYGSYEELLADPEVDVVYVATPHILHHPNTLAALEAGKAVLCEKPLTVSAAQAEELVAAARDRRVFLMEAMWMRCHPVTRRLRQLADAGALGRIRQVRADLGFRADRPPTDRLLAPELGGGALLDLGVYVLHFAQMLLGDPSQVQAVATFGPTGVELDLSVALGWDDGAVGSLSCTLTARSPRTASVATDLGRVDLPEGFHHPAHLTWTSDEETRTLHEEVVGSGRAHEAMEVHRCLRAGEIESPLVPTADSIAVARLMDAVRERIGPAAACRRPAPDRGADRVLP